MSFPLDPAPESLETFHSNVALPTAAEADDANNAPVKNFIFGKTKIFEKLMQFSVVDKKNIRSFRMLSVPILFAKFSYV